MSKYAYMTFQSTVFIFCCRKCLKTNDVSLIHYGIHSVLHVAIFVY